MSTLRHEVEREEWYWNVLDQDYRVLIIHADDCIGCKLGIPLV